MDETENLADSEPKLATKESPVESIQVDSAGFKGDSEIVNDSEIKPSEPEKSEDTEVQNHIVDESSANSANKKDSEVKMEDAEFGDASTQDSCKDIPESSETGSQEGNDEASEEISEPVTQDSAECISQAESEMAVKDDEYKVDESHDENKLVEFETAPNVSMDEPQEDHTEALDPFDALLKDTDASTSEGASGTAGPSVNIIDDDDHNVDTNRENDDDHHQDDTTIEGGDEETEEPGADEEVCLLPDTEREISEADKAEAEKALAEKKKFAEAEAAAAAAEEAALAEKAAAEANEDAVEADAIPKTEEPEDAHNDDGPSETALETTETQENGGEGEGDNEDQTDMEDSEAINNSMIQEIVATSGTCVQCTQQQPCIYKFSTKESKENYLCAEKCVAAFLEEHPNQYRVAKKKYIIEEIAPRRLTCSECEENKTCYFYYEYDGEDTNYCSMLCLYSMMGDERDKYTFIRRKVRVDEIDPIEAECYICNNTKTCNYALFRYGERILVCELSCIKTLNGMENGRYFIKKKPTPPPPPPEPPKVPTPPPPVAPKMPLLKLKVISNATDKYLGDAYKIQPKTPAMVQAAREERENTFVRNCFACSKALVPEETFLTWETMDFCKEFCLGRYQTKIGSKCANCKQLVQHTSMGKYCVRFGYDIRQFCNSSCLEEFKKGLKICCYCQKDISSGVVGFLAPVGDKGQFKDFCQQACMEKYDQINKNAIPMAVWAKCAVCSLEKATTIEVEVNDVNTQRLCSDPCFAAFKFVNNIFPDQCRWCKKYFERKQSKRAFTIYEGTNPFCFCSKSCLNIYISNKRHIVPCNWCKVKKYNFDMIARTAANAQTVMMCSINCLNLYNVSLNAISARRVKCDMCKRTSVVQYHLTMSDATVRNFCTYQCVMSFQSQYTKTPTVPMIQGDPVDQTQAVPTGAPRRTYTNSKTPAKGRQTQTQTQQTQSTAAMPVISNVQSLAAPPPLIPTTTTRAKSKRNAAPPIPIPAPEPEPIQAPKTPPPPPKPITPPPPPPPKIYNHVIVKTLPPKEVANKATMSKPMTASKGISCRPHPCTKECQTDPSLERRVLIPIPVPIYVPVPCAMWSIPFPVPVPIPLPIPVPIFIPTTRNSAKGIMKEINKIHDKMPTDPFEAELLMMAEMVAGDKKKDQSDSDTDDDNAEEGFSPVAGIDGNNAFGEDMLQMALKMATEYEDQPVDLESAMTANTITSSSHPGLEGENMHHQMMVLEQQRAVAALRAGAGRKRAPGGVPAAPAPAQRPTRGKRRRHDPPPPEPQPPPPEKPDANMCLKYTFGVNAWKQWVMTKNAEIEKSSIRRKPFKSEILQLTADELNYSLCLFVKEVRKPNGSEYAPDTIYYLVLGIQQYLFENGRIDNIFTDPYYEKFTDCLDEVARKFSVLYNDSQYIVTRVEEEHLWESKQLGAHSPHVLLSTLMFFNTKHFNLVTVDEHMQLSFSHIMKHWKRNPNQPGQAKIPGARNVLLRFYPPQSALEANSRKKKVYEQQENEENPLRCPVKLYEFYISKCPESVRTRNDVFYLQPERSCVPDSPVWYSTQPLSRTALAKMLHRVKMVKEINIALLTS